MDSKQDNCRNIAITLIEPRGRLADDERLAAIAECKKIGFFPLKNDAKIFQPGLRRFENPITQDAPRVLSPQAIIAQRVSGCDAHDSEFSLTSYRSHILMT
jgi:hypothetical protein